MNNSEAKKSFEELADEALDKVAGGTRTDSVGPCAKCFQMKPLGEYHDPANPAQYKYICADCARDIGYVR